MSGLTNALPQELIALVFLQLASDPQALAAGNTNNHTSVLSLAKTCRQCHKVLKESRAIWAALFASKFDVHPHHIQYDYDIQEEFKRRIDTFRIVSHWNERERRLSPRLAHVECLMTIAFEYRERNFNAFRRAPGVPAFLRRELLCVLKLLRGIENDPAAQARTSLTSARSWLAIFFVLMISDRDFARYLVSNYSSRYDCQDPVNEEFNAVFENPQEHLTTRENSQRALIAILRVLCYSDYDPVKPFPLLSPSWVDLLAKEKGRVILQPASMPSEAALCGRWTGYRTYQRTRCNIVLSFALLAKPHTDPGILYTLSANDGVGESHSFVLSGHMRSDGRVQLLEVRVDGGGEDFTMHGFVLPWGIAGTYEDGLFWVWKEVESDEINLLVDAMGSTHL